MADFFKSLLDIVSSNLTIVVFIAACGLFLAVIMEQLQILAKYDGAMKAKVASGYNSAMKIMVINRLGAVLYFVFVAFAIDTGISPQRLSSFFIGTICALAVVNIGVFSVYFRRFKTELTAEVRSAGRVEHKRQEDLLALCVFAATMLNLLGLTIPLLLSAKFPDYRMTLSNTGFLFNTLFTIINVFIIENYLAKLIDKKDDRLHRIVVSILGIRILGQAGAIGLLMLVAFA
ncbi:hypothetical protein [Fretibacter rubidus]|uniref:hypothetical protein n=1 Tax=Fretibacter rubidus TaxID=570162 RepID=UPI00352BBC75